MSSLCGPHRLRNIFQLQILTLNVASTRSWILTDFKAVIKSEKSTDAGNFVQKCKRTLATFVHKTNRPIKQLPILEGNLLSLKFWNMRDFLVALRPFHTRTAIPEAGPSSTPSWFKFVCTSWSSGRAFIKCFFALPRSLVEMSEDSHNDWCV